MVNKGSIKVNQGYPLGKLMVKLLGLNRRITFSRYQSIPWNWQQFRYIVSYSDVFFPFVCLQCYQ